jgi:glutamine amidotransferase
MAGLAAVGGESLIQKRLADSRPVLGICVGLQVMCERGLEHGVDTPGLGQWPGTVERLEADILPHMGWNTVDVPENSSLFEGVRDERFYFVHSYALKRWTMEASTTMPEPAITWSHQGENFVAAVESGPLCATQFHPEKSGPAGLRLLRNWVHSLKAA